MDRRAQVYMLDFDRSTRTSFDPETGWQMCAVGGLTDKNMALTHERLGRIAFTAADLTVFSKEKMSVRQEKYGWRISSVGMDKATRQNVNIDEAHALIRKFMRDYRVHDWPDAVGETYFEIYN